MKDIPYASAIGSLMYAWVCTRHDIAFVIGMLGRYQSNPGLDNWKAAKKVLRYLQGIKDCMFMYKRSNDLEVIVNSIAKPLKLYCDNSSAIFMAKNNKIGSRSKHILTSNI